MTLDLVVRNGTVVDDSGGPEARAGQLLRADRHWIGASPTEHEGGT